MIRFSQTKNQQLTDLETLLATRQQAGILAREKTNPLVNAVIKQHLNELKKNGATEDEIDDSVSGGIGLGRS